MFEFGVCLTVVALFFAALLVLEGWHEIVKASRKDSRPEYVSTQNGWLARKSSKNSRPTRRYEVR